MLTQFQLFVVEITLPPGANFLSTTEKHILGNAQRMCNYFSELYRLRNLTSSAYSKGLYAASSRMGDGGTREHERQTDS